MDGPLGLETFLKCQTKGLLKKHTNDFFHLWLKILGMLRTKLEWAITFKPNLVQASRDISSLNVKISLSVNNNAWSRSYCQKFQYYYESILVDVENWFWTGRNT